MGQPDSFSLDKTSLMAKSQEDMRAHLDEGTYSMREKVALTCRILFHNGHDSGLAGQITTRGETAGTFLTQRLGLGFDEISPDNLLLVDEHLRVLEGTGMPNPANRFHSWVYRARPDVTCIVHSHAFHTAALSMLEVPLQVSHMDTCILYEDVAFVPKWPGVPVGNDEGELISAALGTKRALLLAHHGLLVAGRTVEEACVIALAFERAAKMQLMAMAAGPIQPIDPNLAREARDWINTPRRNSAAFAYYARRTLAAAPF
ncbi:aldolase [Aquabacter sp. L1I39]|uniref:aldolase n=1 Tax=Aquabacter sp. L1I39 TaxID=2820278 RepID=UPI001ADD1FBF|nr:aldolase [Aquabacter sp. L1I39]QTL02012.1 aldolase [Aquabacter sp. L1I39]